MDVRGIGAVGAYVPPSLHLFFAYTSRSRASIPHHDLPRSHLRCVSTPGQSAACNPTNPTWTGSGPAHRLFLLLLRSSCSSSAGVVWRRRRGVIECRWLPIYASSRGCFRQRVVCHCHRQCHRHFHLISGRPSPHRPHRHLSPICRDRHPSPARIWVYPLRWDCVCVQCGCTPVGLCVCTHT